LFKKMQIIVLTFKGADTVPSLPLKLSNKNTSML
jgi:hypothetical protein